MKPLFLHLPFSIFEGSLAWKLRSHIFHFQVIWRKSRTKASFSHLQLSLLILLEGSLARKLRFDWHLHNCHFLKEVLHESFVFISSTFTFWGRSRTKASFPHLPLSDSKGSLARKLRFDTFNCRNLREVSDCNSCVEVAWRCGCVRSTIY